MASEQCEQFSVKKVFVYALEYSVWIRSSEPNRKAFFQVISYSYQGVASKE